MRDPAFVERRISAQTSPVSGMDRAASRTTPDTIFSGSARQVPSSLICCLAGKNRARHRRSRGRFAVLDPTRSIPGAACIFRRSGGDDDHSAAYRRASGRTVMERRSGRNPTDRGRIAGRTGRTGAAATGGLTGFGERCRPASFPAFSMIAAKAGRRRTGAFPRGERVRQDQRNGVMPFGHSAITHCLHIIFWMIADGAIREAVAPYPVEAPGFLGFSMAPSAEAGGMRHVR
ncbi:hypothetical protein SAMN06295987_1019 [Novosphingobium mathurense]|uniref:Uncharacterized protein n=1 Tax=Novosphingobium mathurense TaxID=428990 RepID=A0A1U6GR53_9SPHN|nr:hypothetical protein SAMN06295987_1019 [Novosphingobium mathurense]